MNELLNQLMPLFITALTIIVGYLAQRLRRYFDEKVSVEQQTQIFRFIKATVDYVEQIGIELPSEAKFQLAKDTVLRYINDKGLNMSEKDLDVIIESFVFNIQKKEVE